MKRFLDTFLPKDWHRVAWTKVLAISATTILLLLGIYQVAVRWTWIGVFLNGRRPPGS
ncbi:MAG: hypothetical protein ACK6DC_02780 [Planctomycetota bacterium]